MILPLLLMTSCKKELQLLPDTSQSLVTVTIQAPGGAQAKSRALSDTDQDDVQQIDILAFDPVTGAFAYAARCTGAEIVSDPGNPSLKSFTVTLRTGTYDLVFLANARSIVSGHVFQGTTKATATALLQASMPSSGTWPADGSALLPMWGEVKGLSVVHGTAINGANAVKMTRMVAAVDIQLSASVATEFEIESVHLYNYNTAGMLVPDVENPLKWNPTLGQAILPNLPSVPGSTKGPVLYDNSAVTADKSKYIGEIFLFEAANGGISDHPDIVCLVVGGKYKGALCYYRVDFSVADPSGNVTYKDILRNHKYTITVNAINSDGSPDEETAYNSATAHLEVSVSAWDLGGEVEVDPDTQRYLWVSDRTINATADADTYTLTLETDAQQWTAVLSDDPTDASAGFSGGWLTIADPTSGTAGVHNFTLSIAANPDMKPRTAYYHITADDRLTAVVTVTQDFDFDMGTIVPSVMSYGYVGAFWRADQTGERLIRIRRSANGTSIDGTWTATVVVGRDWIVLDTEQSDNVTDGGITWVANTENPADMNIAANDQKYRVGGNATTVSGTCEANNTGEIYFRIGLKGKYTPTVAEPARYGVILLTYNNDSQNTLLYLRQGDEADFLMRRTDPTENGTLTTPNGAGEYRPIAAKFSPYNLTAEGFRNGSVTAQYTQLAVNGGTFTDYPSQAGALFQWAISDNIRYAYSPVGDFGVWSAANAAGFWETLRDAHETCPLNWRRPTDGSISGNEAANTDAIFEISELRQSLWINPPETSIGDAGNSLWGYYADGFFDRRAISSNRSVRNSEKSAAFIGNLFYNKYNNASLFFPAPGIRHYSSGVLNNIGTLGYYWTSSVSSGTNARFMYLDSEKAMMHNSNKPNGISIRCIRP